MVSRTTIGRTLSAKLGCEFADADNLHPQRNIEKMRQGIPLDDQDRLPWLTNLNTLLKRWEGIERELTEGGRECGSHSGARGDVVVQGSGAGVQCSVTGVLACSALKRDYRKILSRGFKGHQGSEVDSSCIFVVLNGTKELISERMSGRDHFMPPGLLQSQFDALELPTTEEGNRLIVVEDISSTAASIAENILAELSTVTKDAIHQRQSPGSRRELCWSGLV